MSVKLDSFRSLTGILREARRSHTNGHLWESQQLEQIANLIDSMDDDEQEIANSEGWRGWPDLYDTRMREMLASGKVIETAPDPNDPSTFSQPPRS